LGAAAILLLAGLAMLGVYLASSDRPERPSEPVALAPVQPPPAGAAPVAASPAATAAPATRRPTPLAPPIEYGPAPLRAPTGTWEAVPPMSRPSGAVGQALGAGLAQLQPRISACFSEETQARQGRDPVAATAEDYASLPDTGAIVLMLNLETVQDGVRIVDAPLESRGGASDGLIACAQRALRGQTFDAPGLKPGVRQRLLHPLSQ
jgi:hypothetical protein